MKKYIVASIFAFVFSPISAAVFPDNPVVSNAASSEMSMVSVPVSMVLNFNADFPFATNEVWKTAEGKTFVQFTNEYNKASYAVYTNGQLTESYYGIDVNDLPTISKAHLNTKFPNKIIENVYIIKENGQNQKILVELKGSDDAVYAKEGYFLRYK